MKKLLVLLMILGVVGCSSKRTEPQPSGTSEDAITPEPTDIAQEDFTESKINIDLYKVDEYYPIIDGIVTYPDGTTEEFNNGFMMINLGGGDDYWALYEHTGGETPVFKTYFPDGPYSDELVSELFYVGVNSAFSDQYQFIQDSEAVNGEVDGVFGIEYTDEDGRVYPYVLYRYSTGIPKDQDIQEAFRIISSSSTYYVWRIKDYDSLEVFSDEVEQYGRQLAILWGFPEGDYIPPNRFTFE